MMYLIDDDGKKVEDFHELTLSRDIVRQWIETGDPIGDLDDILDQVQGDAREKPQFLVLTITPT